MADQPHSTFAAEHRPNDYVRLGCLGLTALLTLKIASMQAEPAGYSSAPPPSPLVWPLAILCLAGLGWLGFQMFRSLHDPKRDLWLPWRRLSVIQEILIAGFGAALFTILPAMFLIAPAELAEHRSLVPMLITGPLLGGTGFVLLAFRPGILVDVANGRVVKYRFARALPWTAVFPTRDLKVWSSWTYDKFSSRFAEQAGLDPHVYYVYAKVDAPGGGDFLVTHMRFPRSAADVKHAEDAWRAYFGVDRVPGDAPTPLGFGVTKR